MSNVKSAEMVDNSFRTSRYQHRRAACRSDKSDGCPAACVHEVSSGSTNLIVLLITSDNI